MRKSNYSLEQLGIAHPDPEGFGADNTPEIGNAAAIVAAGEKRKVGRWEKRGIPKGLWPFCSKLREVLIYLDSFMNFGPGFDSWGDPLTPSVADRINDYVVAYARPMFEADVWPIDFDAAALICLSNPEKTSFPKSPGAFIGACNAAKANRWAKEPEPLALPRPTMTTREWLAMSNAHRGKNGMPLLAPTAAEEAARAGLLREEAEE